MIGVIERGPGKVVHCRIDDDIGVGHPRLHPDHPGEQHTGIAGNDAAGFKHQFDIPAPGDAGDHGAEFGRARRYLARAIGHAKSTAEIDPVDRVASGAQISDEQADPRKRCL